MNTKLNAAAAVAVIAAFALFTLNTCGSSAPAERTSAAEQTNPAGQTTAVVAAAPEPASPFFTGGGGRGMSLAVLVPESSGIAAEQNYLPTLVQGVLVGDLSKYSAIAVLDRMRLESVLKETESGIYKDEASYGQLGEIANVDYALTGSITRTGAGYAMQIQIVGTGKDNIGQTRASYSGNFTIAELDNFTGIRRASIELLTQMGVTLTAQAQQELTAASAVQTVNSQRSLSQGIVAQRQGTEVAALSYYLQAAAIDSSLQEAVGRSTITTANISSGNIGVDARNDINWRRDWVARLTETEQLIDNILRTAPCFELSYGTKIQKGAINYQNETIVLSIPAHVGWSRTIADLAKVLGTVQKGLHATGRSHVWGLDRWPEQPVTNLNAFRSQSGSFSIVMELVNSQNQVIGRQTFQDTVSVELFDPRYSIQYPYMRSRNLDITSSTGVDNNLVRFTVKADDITGDLTIRVVSVNGVTPETTIRNGLLERIRVNNIY